MILHWPGEPDRSSSSKARPTVATAGRLGRQGRPSRALAMHSLSCLILVASLAGAARKASAEVVRPLLTVGSSAPQLDVEHWLGDPERAPIARFEPGTVYIVEFWATWCGPCVAAIPHMADLQDEYRSKGVTLIAVTTEELDTVESFLERPLPSKRKQHDLDEALSNQPAAADLDSEAETFRHFTDVYRLAADPDESVFNDYMAASGEGGIPTAFLVGKSGVIEWVGQPGGGLLNALDQVLSDQWDREAFANRYRTKQEIEALSRRGLTAFNQEQFDEVRQAINELRAYERESALQRAGYLEYKLEFLEVIESVKTTPAVGAKRLDKLYTELKLHPRRMFFTTTSVLEMLEESEIALDDSTIIAIANHCESAGSSDKAGLDEGILFNIAGRLYTHVGKHREAAASYRRAVSYAEAKSKGQLDWFRRDLEKSLARQTDDTSVEDVAALDKDLAGASSASQASE